MLDILLAIVTLGIGWLIWDIVLWQQSTSPAKKMLNLRIVDTVLTSTTRLIANKKAWENPEKRAKIEQLAMLLQGALAAESRVLIKLNVPAEKLDAVSAILPSLHAPTINKLNDSGWFAVESVVEEKVVRDIVPPLRAAGAEGIIELPLNKVIF